MSDEGHKVQDLADELLESVETAQGYFFVSDGETFPTTAQFFERIRGRLEYGKLAVRKMRAFLKKHGELK